jgi:uncharacterized protein (AIM24 family)
MPFMFETSTELALRGTTQGHGESEMFAKKGSMVAYQGKFKFEKVLLDSNGGGFIKSVTNHAMRRLSGENLELMKVKGSGVCYFADEAQHVTIINLNQGDALSVESENLLAFNDAVKYGVRFIGVGVISQKGLFTSKLEPKAAGAQVAVKSDGNPIILDTPCVVDPDAVVCWTGPDPSFKMDLNWKTFIGQSSGESYMLEFKQAGYHVIVQPSERLSGLKVGIDDNRYQPESQGNPLQNSVGNMQQTVGQVGQFGQQFQQGQGGHGQGNSQGGGIAGTLGQIMNTVNNRTR